MSKINYPAIFNDIDLTVVPGLTVLKTDPYRPAKRNVSLSELIRTDKSKLNSANYNERYITVGVEITRNTRAEMEQSLDRLLSILQPTEKWLVLNQGQTRRKYLCTYADYLVNEDTEGGSFLQIDLIFVCSDRFGYDLSETTLLNFTGYTSANRSDRLTFNGSAKWQCPIIALTFTSITGGTSKTVTVGNGDNGQQISVTRTWSNNDVLVIDCLNEEVLVNGVVVDHDGAIPKWTVGFGYWNYQDNFTARSLNGNLRCGFRYV